MTKKLMALLLAVLMAVSLLPMPAMAGDAQVITDLSGISAGGSYVVDKSVKDIVLSAPLTLDKDVTLELTGQTVTLKLADGESYADASVFHVESGSLTLKGSGTVKVPDNASGVVVAKDAAVTISGEVGISGGASGVKAVVGASGVKIRVNTLGKIESETASTCPALPARSRSPPARSRAASAPLPPIRTTRSRSARCSTAPRSTSAARPPRGSSSPLLPPPK